MDILILGNGFDLAHKLDTKYGDFLKYCQEKYSTTRSVGVDKSNNFLYNNIWTCNEQGCFNGKSCKISSCYNSK